MSLGSHKSYVGIDIGNSSIKIVEFENASGRPKLLTYGFLEENVDILKSESPEDVARVVEAILKIKKEARVLSNKAVAALPSFTVFSSIIALPKMSKKEIVSAVKWEAKKFVPMPLDEMILDWKVLSADLKDLNMESIQHESPQDLKKESPITEKVTQENTDPLAKAAEALHGNKETIRVLLTAAPKKLVQRYTDIYKAANLELVSLETESFALERSLIGNDPSSIIIVDIGAVSCDISVIVNKIPILSRSIDVGGRTITTGIAKSLNVTEDRAEQFKRDFGLAVPDGGASDQVPQNIAYAINAIVNEIRYILNLYHSHSEKPMEKIIVSGGSSFIPGLPQHLEKELRLRTYIGDPWARVVYPVELKPILTELGPRFAVAVGLAMREIV